MNPHNSIWNTRKEPFIKDKILYHKWASIKKYLTSRPNIMLIQETQLKINNQFLISKNSSKFRLLSQLDWAVYDNKDLAQAIDNNAVENYYEKMLMNSLSDPNVWNDKTKEQELKVYYAARVGRASKI